MDNTRISLMGSIARYLINELDFNLDDAFAHSEGIVDDAILPNFTVVEK